MYWYSFTDSEIEQAGQQAKAQAEDKDDEDGGLQEKKFCGNLGEYTLRAFFRDFAKEHCWSYLPEEAHENSNPEYHSVDFTLNQKEIDVKTSTSIRKFSPLPMEYGREEHTPAHVLWHEDVDYFVFSLVTEDRPLTNEGSGHSKTGILLGWATRTDISDEAIKQRYIESYRGDGQYLPFNNMVCLLREEGALGNIELSDFDIGPD